MYQYPENKRHGLTWLVGWLLVQGVVIAGALYVLTIYFPWI